MSSLKKCIATENFIARDDTELTLRRNDEFYLVEWLNDAYSIVMQGSQKGKVPNSAFRIITEEENKTLSKSRSKEIILTTVEDVKVLLTDFEKTARFSYVVTILARNQKRTWQFKRTSEDFKEFSAQLLKKGSSKSYNLPSSGKSIDNLKQTAVLQRWIQKLITRKELSKNRSLKKFLSPGDFLEEKVEASEFASELKDKKKMNTCLQCHSDFSVSDLITLQCGHMFCNNCLRDHVEKIMLKKSRKMECPYGKCGRNLNSDEILACVSEEKYEDYVSFSLGFVGYKSDTFEQKKLEEEDYLSSSGLSDVEPGAADDSMSLEEVPPPLTIGSEFNMILNAFIEIHDRVKNLLDNLRDFHDRISSLIESSEDLSSVFGDLYRVQPSSNDRVFASKRFLDISNSYGHSIANMRSSHDLFEKSWLENVIPRLEKRFMVLNSVMTKVEKQHSIIDKYAKDRRDLIKCIAGTSFDDITDLIEDVKDSREMYETSEQNLFDEISTIVFSRSDQFDHIFYDLTTIQYNFWKSIASSFQSFLNERNTSVIRTRAEEAVSLTWVSNLSDVLAHPLGIRSLRKFMKSQMCEENLSFILDCRTYSSFTGSLEERSEKVEEMLKRYIKSNATEQVNLPVKIRRDIEDRAKILSPTLFEEAEKAIHTLILKDIFPRYIASKEYNEFIGKMRTLNDASFDVEGMEKSLRSADFMSTMNFSDTSSLAEGYAKPFSPMRDRLANAGEKFAPSPSSASKHPGLEISRLDSWHSDEEIDYTSIDSKETDITFYVNDKLEVGVKGELLIHALKKAGHFVPSFCYHPRLNGNSLCRTCSVELDVGPYVSVVPSCSTTLRPGIKIYLNTDKSRNEAEKALHTIIKRQRRRALMPIAYDESAGDKVGEEYKKFYKYSKIGKRDTSVPSLIHDSTLCVECGRCVTVCKDLAGPSVFTLVPGSSGDSCRIKIRNGNNLSESSCISCGLCVQFCPTGALTDNSNVDEMAKSLGDKSKYNICIVSPAALLDCTRKLQETRPSIEVAHVLGALRSMGFKKLVDIDIGYRISAYYVAHSFAKRLKGDGILPMFSGACPSFINLIEKDKIHFIQNTDGHKAPNYCLATLLHGHFFGKLGIKSEDFVVSELTLCSASKISATSPTYMMKSRNLIQYSSTSREMIDLLENFDWDQVEGSSYDPLFDIGMPATSTHAWEIPCSFAHAVVSLALKMMGKKDNERLKFRESISNRSIMEVESNIGNRTIRAAVITSGKATRDVLGEAFSELPYDYIEAWVCPKGCIGGGGCIPNRNPDFLEDAEALYRMYIESRDVVHPNEDSISVNVAETKKTMLTLFVDRKAEKMAKKRAIDGSNKIELDVTFDPEGSRKKVFNLKVVLLYATQTGQSLELATIARKILIERGIQVRVCDIYGFKPRELPSLSEIVIFIMPTSWEQAFPPTAKRLWKYLVDQSELNEELREDFGALKFGVFGSGNSRYPHFNICSILLDKRLAALHAHRYMELKLGDSRNPEEMKQTLAVWIDLLSMKLHGRIRSKSSFFSIKKK